MKGTNPMPQLVAPDEWNSENGAITQVIKWLNTFQTSSTHFSREELQSIVDQAAERYGIRAAGECFTIEDKDGDIWVWDQITETFRWRDTETYPEGFEEGVADIMGNPGIKED